MQGAWRGSIPGYRDGAIQDLGYDLPRIPIPRTSVNKGKKKGRGCSHSLSPGPPLVADLYPPRLLLWPILGCAARICCAALECLKSRLQAGGGGRGGSAPHFVGVCAERVQFPFPSLVLNVLTGCRTDAVVVHVEVSVFATLQQDGCPPARRALREHRPQRTPVDVARRGDARKVR